MTRYIRKVPIQNIYFMLSYVWDKAFLNSENKVANFDDFSSIEILSEIFLLHVKDYFSKGLYQEYSEINDEIRGIKGKIDFKNSIDNLSFQNAKSYCLYDILEVNNSINQIIKSTALRLYRSKELANERKNSLNNVLLYLNSVDIINLKKENFHIAFNTNNYYCYPMIMVCKLIYECTMLSDQIGVYKFVDIYENDRVLSTLFELFVYRFYKKETKNKVEHHKIINWNVSDEIGNKNLLPKMELDIKVEDQDSVYIIDTKFYKNFYLEKSYDLNNEPIKKFISSNLYQLFSYMNHINTDKNLTGILLYPTPETGEEIDETYIIDTISGGRVVKSRIKIKTINLGKEWRVINNDLKQIISKSNY
jgi:5-methylcytosine-specific restriction enzyme subunit McrC